MELLDCFSKDNTLEDIKQNNPSLKEFKEVEENLFEISNDDLKNKTGFPYVFLHFEDNKLDSIIYQTKFLNENKNIQQIYINKLENLKDLYKDNIEIPQHVFIDKDKLKTQTYTRKFINKNDNLSFELSAVYYKKNNKYFIELIQNLSSQLNVEDSTENDTKYAQDYEHDGDFVNLNNILKEHSEGKDGSQNEDTDSDGEDNLISNIQEVINEETYFEATDDEEINNEKEDSSDKDSTETDSVEDYNSRKKTAFMSSIVIGCYLLIGIIASLAVIIWFSKEPFKLAKKSGDIANIIYYIVSFIFYGVTLILIPLSIMFNFYDFKKYICNSEDIFRNHNIKNKHFKSIINNLLSSYKSTFIKISDNTSAKTRANADLYFNFDTVVSNMTPKVPLAHMMKLAGGSFIGFGILGTFLGFAVAMKNLNLSSASEMMEGIRILVNQGLTTAFNTSIVGVICSIIYNFLIYSPLIHHIELYLEKLCDDLDKTYYITETEALMMSTMTHDEDGVAIPFSDSLGMILDNMHRQTEAFTEFTGTLADKIANVQNVVNEQMSHFTKDLSSGVTDQLLNGVQEEIGGLKEALVQATDNLNEASNSISETVDKIDNETSDILQNFNVSLNKSLVDCKNAADLLNTVPDKLKNITDSLDTAGDKMASSSETICDNMSSVTGELSNVAESIDQLMQSANTILDQTNTNEVTSGQNLNAVVESTTKILEDFNAINRKLSDIFQQITEKVNSYNKTSSDVLAGYLTSFADSTKSYSATVQGSVHDLENTLENVNTTLSDINKTSNGFERAIKHLETTLKRQ